MDPATEEATPTGKSSTEADLRGGYHCRVMSRLASPFVPGPCCWALFAGSRQAGSTQDGHSRGDVSDVKAGLSLGPFSCFCHR